MLQKRFLLKSGFVTDLSNKDYPHHHQGDSQFEIEIEDNLRAGSQQVLSDACVRIYTSSLCALRDVVEHPPQFFTGKTIMWCHRPSQSEIDAVWIEKKPDGEEVLVNLRRNSRSAV